MTKRRPPGGGGLRGMFGGGGGGAGAGSQQLGGRMTPVVLWLIVGSAALFVIKAFTTPKGARFPEWAQYVILYPHGMFKDLYVWTPVTSMFLEVGGLAFIFSIMAMWLFVPALERHWGAKRFLFYFLSVGVLANLINVTLAHFYQPLMLFGGFGDATLGVVVAFGVLYGKYPVSFFGVLPMTGRQLTLVIVGISYVQFLLTGNWIMLISTTAVVLYTLLLTSARYSPAKAWERWKLARMKRRYVVLQGGRDKDTPPKKWLN